MIHKVAAATLMVHSRHTGSSTPATTGSNILLGSGGYHSSIRWCCSEHCITFCSGS